MARHRRAACPASWRADPGPRPLRHLPPHARASEVRPGAALAWSAHTSALADATLPCYIRLRLPASTYRLWWETDLEIAERLDGPSAPWQRLLVLLRHFLAQWDTAAYEQWSEGYPVHARFGWMCAAPGCTGRRNLERHHIIFRSRHGPDDASNLVSLCAGHHRAALHGAGGLRVSGKAPDALLWELPIGRLGGDVHLAPGVSFDPEHSPPAQPASSR